MQRAQRDMADRLRAAEQAARAAFALGRGLWAMGRASTGLGYLGGSSL